MSKKKEKKKKTESGTHRKPESGTIVVLTESISQEEQDRIVDRLKDLDCEFKIFLKEECEIVKTHETYWGRCPWCQEYIFTKDVCPVCGKFVDLS